MGKKSCLIKYCQFFLVLKVQNDKQWHLYFHISSCLCICPYSILCILLRGRGGVQTKLEKTSRVFSMNECCCHLQERRDPPPPPGSTLPCDVCPPNHHHSCTPAVCSLSFSACCLLGLYTIINRQRKPQPLPKPSSLPVCGCT